MKALLLVSHGSKSTKATEEVIALTRALREKASAGYAVVEYAFLDVAEPSIPQGIDACARRGSKEIVILPHFLVSGNHVLKDIPAFIEAARQRYPDVNFVLAPFLGSHGAIADLLIELAGRS